MKNEGGFMSVSTIVFVIGILACIGAVLIYLKAEDTPFHKTLEKINAVSGDVKELKTMIENQDKTIKEQNTKIQQAEWELAQMKLVNTETSKECDAAQDHCAKLREGQIELRDMISKRRPVTKIQGPIQIEILTPSKRYPGVVKPKPQQTQPKQEVKPPPVPKSKKTSANGSANLGKGLASLLPEQNQ